MTGGKIRIPRAPGSPGKKKPGKRENKMYGWRRGQARACYTVVSNRLFQFSQFICGSWRHAQPRSLDFLVVASSSSSSSQRGVRIRKQNRSLEAWRKIISPTNSPVPKRVSFLGDCTSIGEVSYYWANCIPRNSLTPRLSAIYRPIYLLFTYMCPVSTYARWPVDDINTQQARLFP